MNGIRIDPSDSFAVAKIKNAASLAELQTVQLALASASAPPDLSEYQKSLDQSAGFPLPILSLVSTQYTLADLVSAEPSRADAAESEFLALLRLSASIPNEPVVVIPSGLVDLDCDYELAFHHACQRIRKLVKLAESLAVRFALENPAAGFLLSPLEIRDLIDAMNTPFFGLCLNLDHAQTFTRPADWLKIFDRRILAVHYLAPLPSAFHETLRAFAVLHAPLPLIHIA